MEVFARRAVEKIADLGLAVRVLTTTVHGTGYGLDGGEALQRLVQGFREGLSIHKLTAIERITFLTLGERSERMLSTALAAIATSTLTAPETAATTRPARRHMVPTGPTSTPAVAETAAVSLPALPEARTNRRRRQRPRAMPQRAPNRRVRQHRAARIRPRTRDRP